MSCKDLRNQFIRHILPIFLCSSFELLWLSLLVFSRCLSRSFLALKVYVSKTCLICYNCYAETTFLSFSLLSISFLLPFPSLFRSLIFASLHLLHIYLSLSLFFSSLHRFFLSLNMFVPLIDLIYITRWRKIKSSLHLKREIKKIQKGGIEFCSKALEIYQKHLRSIEWSLLT